MASLMDFVRISGIDAGKRSPLAVIVQIHARIIKQVRFSNEYLDTFRSLYDKRQKSELAVLPLGKLMIRICILERIIELGLERLG